MNSSVRLVATVCLAELLTMVGVFTFPALMPDFIAEWGLNNTEAGWIAGVMLGGYACGVPVLVSLTDREDARLVHIGGSIVTALSLVGFVLIAEGFLSALILRFFAGVGLAATYMPGLRMLMDRYEGHKQARSVAFYTASFSLGTAISFFVSGELGSAFGWQTAIWVAAVSAALAVLLVFVSLQPVAPAKPDEPARLLDFRPIFQNRAAMGYIWAYGAHNWELFAYRSWMVAFLAFSLTLQPDAITWGAPTLIATFSAIVAVLTSIGGNELADRFGRRRMICLYLIAAGTLGLFAGFLPALPYGIVAGLMLLYAALIQLDSAALTAGAVSVAEEGRRGATLGLHALIGFAGAAIGPLVFGMLLDIGGGREDIFAWGLGFASMGGVALLGPVALWLLRPKTGDVN
jgi:MFS family permease